MIGLMVLAVIWCLVGFGIGAIWRDRRALRTERELWSRVEALRIVARNERQQYMSLHRYNQTLRERVDVVLDPCIDKTLKAADEYQTKIEAGYPGTQDWAFNRGVRHGLQSAVIFMRGWL